MPFCQPREKLLLQQRGRGEERGFGLEARNASHQVQKSQNSKQLLQVAETQAREEGRRENKCRVASGTLLALLRLWCGNGVAKAEWV